MKIKTLLLTLIIILVITAASFFLLAKGKMQGQIIDKQETTQAVTRTVVIKEIKREAGKDYKFKIDFSFITLEEISNSKTATIEVTTVNNYQFVVYQNSQKIGVANKIIIGTDNSISFDKTIPNLTGNVRIVAKKIK